MLLLLVSQSHFILYLLLLPFPYHLEQTSSLLSMRVAYSDQSPNPVCGFSMMNRLDSVLFGLSSGELAWHFQNHLQGWMNDLNMLLSCLREKMPDLELGSAIRQQATYFSSPLKTTPSLSVRRSKVREERTSHNVAQRPNWQSGETADGRTDKMEAVQW